MRIPAGVLLLATLLGAVLVLLAGQALLQPDLPLITDAGFTPQRISPNADGEKMSPFFTTNSPVTLALPCSLKTRMAGATFSARMKRASAANTRSPLAAWSTAGRGRRNRSRAR